MEEEAYETQGSCLGVSKHKIMLLNLWGKGGVSLSKGNTPCLAV